MESLLDAVWRDLNNVRIWKNAPGQTGPIYRDHYANYRRLFAQARCFNISNKALEVAVELSGEGPQKVAERLFMARLPFPKVWIEYDFKYKVICGNRNGFTESPSPETPERLGWLFQEDPSDPLRWTMTTWVSVTDKKPAHIPHQGEMKSSMSMVSWMIDTANRSNPERIGAIQAIDRQFLKGVVRWDGFQDNLGPEHDREPAWQGFRHLGWGYTAGATDPRYDGMDPMRQLSIAPQLQHSINVGIEPMSRQIFPLTYEDQMTEQFVNSCIESRGDVRLAVALLSLINEVPIVETPNQKKGSFMGAGGVMRKYLHNNTVTINIPAKKPMKQIRSLLNSKVKSHKARHEVRGHWRTIVHKEDHIRKRTQPDGSIVEEFIAKGQLERVWVKHHERGDASYGYVKHDYRVEKQGDNSKHHQRATRLQIEPELQSE